MEAAFVYVLSSVDVWFGENTFEVLHQEMLNFVLLGHSVSILVFQGEDSVMMAMVYHGFVEKFGVFVSFKPLGS